MQVILLYLRQSKAWCYSCVISLCYISAFAALCVVGLTSKDGSPDYLKKQWGDHKSHHEWCCWVHYCWCHSNCKSLRSSYYDHTLQCALVMHKMPVVCREHLLLSYLCMLLLLNHHLHWSYHSILYSVNYYLLYPLWTTSTTLRFVSRLYACNMTIHDESLVRPDQSMSLCWRGAC
jgi:hypothetical protein